MAGPLFRRFQGCVIHIPIIPLFAGYFPEEWSFGHMTSAVAKQTTYLFTHRSYCLLIAAMRVPPRPNPYRGLSQICSLAVQIPTGLCLEGVSSVRQQHLHLPNALSDYDGDTK